LSIARSIITGVDAADIFGITSSRSLLTGRFRLGMIDFEKNFKQIYNIHQIHKVSAPHPDKVILLVKKHALTVIQENKRQTDKLEKVS
jgi:hypothetical protein